MRINQRQFVAVSSKSNGSALGKLDAKAIGQDALHAGGFDPGNLFQLTPAGVQRDAQNTPVAVVDKLLEHRFALTMRLPFIRSDPVSAAALRANTEETASIDRHGHTSNATQLKIRIRR